MWFAEFELSEFLCLRLLGGSLIELLLFGYLAFVVWVWFVDLKFDLFLIVSLVLLLVWEFVLVFGWLLWLFDCLLYVLGWYCFRFCVLL